MVWVTRSVSMGLMLGVLGAVSAGLSGGYLSGWEVPAALVLSVWFLHRTLFVRVFLQQTRAQVLGGASWERLHDRNEVLAASFGLRGPARLYWMEGATRNAYAIGGPRYGAIILTRGLLETTDLDVLEACLAHEYAHIRHGDSFWLLLHAMGLSFLRALLWVLRALAIVLVVTIGLALAALRMGNLPGGGFLWASRWATTIVEQIVLGLGRHLSRASELRADREAARVIGADRMVDALKTIGPADLGRVRTLWQRLQQSHPTTQTRIRALKQAV